MPKQELAPRWRTAIEKALEDDPKADSKQFIVGILPLVQYTAYIVISLVYQLSTTSTTPENSVIPRPHVRSIGHRGFLDSNSPAMPLLLTTTDARTPKLSELAHNASVELAWNFPCSKAQARIAGLCYVYIARSFVLSDGDCKRLTREQQLEIAWSAHLMRSAFKRAVTDGVLGPKEYDWKRERRFLFESGSGTLRAWGARPTPGLMLLPEDNPSSWPETIPTLAEAEQDKSEEGKKMLTVVKRNKHT